MPYEKRRILELFYVLSQQDGYINSSELAEIVKVSERTIKNDIKELELFVDASGGRLVSKKGSGYKLEVIDIELFLPVQKQLSYRFLSQNLYSLGELQQRTNDILRRLIVEKDFITIDDIAEELYLTKSSIAMEMKEVQRVLASYNLRIKKKGEDGPYIIGKEFDRRLLMVRIFEVHYHDALPLFKYSDYTRFFDRDEEERLEIRQVLLSVLRKAKLHIYDDFTQRISRYLILSANRNFEGFTLQFTIEEKEFIRSFRQFKVAETLITELQPFEKFTIDENEAYGVALLFLFWVDLDADEDLENEYAPVFAEAYQLVKQTQEAVTRDYNIDLSQVKNWDRLLLTSFIQLTIQLRFNCANNSIQSTGVISRDVRYSPLSIALARVVSGVLYEAYDIWFSMYNMLFVANRFYFIFNQIGYDYRRIKAAIVSMNGLEAAKAIKLEVNQRVGQYFEKLDIYELYEMRPIPKDEYDWVILSIPYFSYNYDWPYVLIDMIPTQQQMNDVYNQIVLDGVQLEVILEEMELEEVMVYRNFDFDNLENFKKLLSFKLGQSSEDIELLNAFLDNSMYGCCYNKVAVLFIPNNLVHQQLIDIYQLEAKSSWLGEDVELIMIVSLDFKGNLPMARMMEQFTNECMSNPEQLWLLAENPRKEYIMEIIKEKLKIRPIALIQGK